jgi:hypothetical protein
MCIRWAAANAAEEGQGGFSQSDVLEDSVTSLATAVLLGLLADPLPVNEQVVAFARSQLGQRVGNGECTALVARALRHAGARLHGRGQGAWGRELKSLGEARPGDILQFEDATFVRRRVREDGALVTLTFRHPHHTAIVAGVRKRGPRPVFVILHQNAGVEGGDEESRKVVQEWTIDLAEKRGGTVRAYRPVAE